MIQLEIVGKDFPRVGSAHAIEDVGPIEPSHVNPVGKMFMLPVDVSNKSRPLKRQRNCPLSVCLGMLSK